MRERIRWSADEKAKSIRSYFYGLECGTVGFGFEGRHLELVLVGHGADNPDKIGFVCHLQIGCRRRGGAIWMGMKMSDDLRPIIPCLACAHCIETQLGIDLKGLGSISCRYILSRVNLETFNAIVVLLSHDETATFFRKCVGRVPFNDSG